MILLWEIDDDIRSDLDPTMTELMQRAADQALVSEGVSRACTVTVRLCGDDAIHEINKEHRDIDRATDVLSFPNLDFEAPGDFSLIEENEAN